MCAATSAIKILEIPISMGFFAKYCRASSAFISELNISLLGLIYLSAYSSIRLGSLKVPSSSTVFLLSEYKCEYMKCDYSVWSTWSTTCGKGMTRKRTLTKMTKHTIEQQGGCSGLPTTCNKQNVETKDSICKCFVGDAPSEIRFTKYLNWYVAEFCAVLLSAVQDLQVLRFSLPSRKISLVAAFRTPP